MPLRILIALAFVFMLGCSAESRKARHLERANKYLRAGQIDKAEVEYANVLQIDPINKAANRQLGLIYFDQGRPNRAFPLLKQAEDSDPEAIDVRVRLASLYLAGRKYKEVRDEADYILRKQPGHDDALVLLADAAQDATGIEATRRRLEGMRAELAARPGFHLALGVLAFREKKAAEAEAFFKEAVRIDPNLAIAHTMLANLYASQESLSAAEAHYKTAFDLSPLHSERKLDYIDFKVRHGDMETGKKLLEELVQKAPDNLPAINRLAELNVGRKKYDDASALLRKALSRDPQNFEALLTQGLLNLALADSAKAISHFERMAAAFPTVPKVRYHLAVAFLATNDVAEAINNLNQVIRQDPEYGEAVLLLADINARKGDSSTAIALLSDLIRKKPRLAEAHLLLANAYRLRNNLESALSVYARLTEIFPNNVQIPLLTGTVLLQQNKTNEARKQFEKALALAPNHLPALEQLIALDLMQQQFSPAVDRIQKELERSPNSPELHVLLAKAYHQAGQTNNVERELLRALELNPLQREPYLLLARFYVTRNEHLQAIDRLKRLLARDSTDAAALMLLGVIHEQLKDYPIAREMYEKVLTVTPSFSLALNNLAYLYSEHLNDLDRAFQMAQRARALLPREPSAADTLGWILFKREDYPWALSLLQESSDKMANDPEVLYHFGMAQYMMGYEGAARGSLARAVQLSKDFQGRELCVRRLAILEVDVTRIDAQNIRELEEQLLPHNDDPVALAKLAAAYEHTGATSKAQRAYEQALALSPKNVSVMIRLAQLQQRQGNRSKAMDLARKARALAPDDPSIAHALGRIAFDTGQPSEMQWAHSLLQESARKLPDDPNVACDLAWSHFSMGRLPEAEAALRAALNSKRLFVRSDEARRFLKFITGDIKGSDARTAVAQEPDYMPAMFAAAVEYERANDLANSQKTYEALLRRAPLFYPAHQRLAVMFDSQGNLAKALEHANKAREQAPTDPEVAKILGILSFKRGEFARSAQLLREGARHRRSDAEIFYYLGMAHYRLRQHSESKDALRQAVALRIPASMAQEANRVLAEMN